MTKKQNLDSWAGSLEEEYRWKKAEELGIHSADLGKYEVFDKKFIRLNMQLEALNEKASNAASSQYVTSELVGIREDLRLVFVICAFILLLVGYIAWKVL
jgi:hypothetical protein